MADGIIMGSKYGDARRQAAADDGAHGLSGRQIEALNQRFEQMLPSITKGGGPRDSFTDVLPPGASWSPRGKKTAQGGPSSIFGPTNGPFGMGGNGSGNTLVTQQRPYQPEFESPDRQQYPVHRILANRYWRLFYKLDPVAGNCIDMFSEMPWSNFELTGDGVDGEIREGYERMCDITKVLTLLPYFIKEYLVIGEVVPHLFYDQNEQLWSYIALHNPDQLEVVDAPFIKMDPIVEFIPDDRLRTILTSERPALRRIREQLPPELLTRLYARQNIPLSPLNATFIPRKLHPYDVRGTSVMSRLWRVFMLEDAIFNATIATARRHAGPLKVAKLGNAATGWIPGPEHEQRLLQLLAQAELDPQAWLVYNYGINFETIGTTDRIMSINTHWEVIERIKLVALGISKSFLHGEVTYSSASTGLQVFLTRLKAMRTFFEQIWMYPKFFRPIAEMNGWTRSTPAEISHHFRVKRSKREMIEQNRYIVPKIIWDKTLDPQVNANLINAIQVLESVGCKFSKTTKMATVGSSYEEEQKKIKFEEDFEKQFLPKKPAGGEGEQAGGAGGGAVSEDAPPSPGGDAGEGGEGGGTEGAPPPAPASPGATPGAPAPAGASAEGDKKETKPTMDDGVEKTQEPKEPGPADSDILTSKIWIDNKFGNWNAEEAEGLVTLFNDGETESAFWNQLLDRKKPAVGEGEKDSTFMRALLARDFDLALAIVGEFLEDQGYPQSDIAELTEILEAEGCIGHPESSRLVELEKMLPDDSMGMNDKAFDQMVGSAYDKAKAKMPATPSVVKPASKSAARKIKMEADESFLVGAGNNAHNPLGSTDGLLGDISGLLPRK